MFNKTRNRILLLNMAMVSSVVIFAFVVIFATTYTRAQNEIDTMLSAAPPPNIFNVYGAAFRPGGVAYPESGFFAGQNRFSMRVPPDVGRSFSLLVDYQNEIVDINSMIDIEYDTYTLMASQALESIDSQSVLNVDGRMWRYTIIPVSVVSREISEPASSVFIMSSELHYIRFLDVTESYRTIRSLALILSVLLIVILVVFYFISRFFANRAIKPMQEAWEKQNRFIADASHELKTPLSIINANCGVLYSDIDETIGSQLRWVDSIMRAADRMTGFANSMLSLISLEDTQLELRRGPLDLSAAVSSAVDEIEAPAVKKSLSVYREIESGVEVDSNWEHVHRILSILLDNAVKYTDVGGEIVISLSKENKRVVCSVRNSGSGIPAEDLPRLFDRFYRGDPARSSEISGYGLGLSIAKGLANQLGAELTVKSVLGEFAEFSLAFVSARFTSNT